MRRLYEVMRTSAYSLVAWLFVLLVLSVTEMQSESFSKNVFQTYTFVVLQLPLHGLVLFGSKALCSIGYHLMVLQDCNDAHDELQQQIKMAKADLVKKGVKL